MAGYVFAIGGDTEIIKICAERGVYATRLNSLASRPFEATLADYVSMKPGDNVYFFSERKIYGIGELVAVGQIASIQIFRVHQLVQRSITQM